MKAHYDTLGVSKNASETEIKKAYRTLSLKYHPDRNTDRDAKLKFQEINSAYEILRDSQKRKMYDMGIDPDEIPNNGGFPFPGGGFPFPGGGFHFPGGGVHFAHMGGGHEQPPDINDIFETIFGGLGGGGPPPFHVHTSRPNTSRGRPMRGPKIHVFHQNPPSPPRSESPPFPDKPEPIEKTIQLTLEQLYHGENLPVILERLNNETNMQEKQHLQVPIPAGMKDGETILLTGVGNRGYGNAHGDVKLTIKEMEHPIFKRNGFDLIHHLKISLQDAFSGFSCEIKHLSGKTLRLNNKSSPSVIQPGSVREFPTYGMIQGNKRGNLFVYFVVDLPTNLNSSQLSRINEILNEKPETQDETTIDNSSNISETST
mgnify:CR=1 FL=1